MDRGVLDRELILDLTVNIVPLALILLFAVGTVVVTPLGRARLPIHLGELFLLAVPFVVLAVVTYLAGRAIALDERSLGPGALPPGIVSSRASTPDGVGEIPDSEQAGAGETTAVDDEAEPDEVAVESESEDETVAEEDEVVGEEDEAVAEGGEAETGDGGDPVPETERESGTGSEA